jgi:hypothetical protein
VVVAADAATGVASSARLAAAAANPLIVFIVRTPM